MFLDFFIFKFLNLLILYLIILFITISLIIIYIYFSNESYNESNNHNMDSSIEEESQDPQDDENDDSNNFKKDNKDILLLKSIDDTNDPNLRNFKLCLIDVKKAFGNYWHNYFNWHYQYNGGYRVFNWYRFNKWTWNSKNYDALKKKSDSDFSKLKISWFKFQEAYLKLSRDSSYHNLATRIFLRNLELLQSIKKNILSNFSKK